MENLKDLSLKQLLALYDECIERDEQKISDECFRRYGIRLNETSWWGRNNFFIGVMIGLVLSVVIRFLI
ncbi:hypothetical protein [Patiriisocius marinus]|uniref:hypothetical protein n=1 Tax=Patiriisocius marinus TaxID=1397112 RepID=UPI00232C4572|nr:hypothetical protein [Patiriisocius marinus]